MAALESGIKDVTNMMASAALKPKRAASPPPRPKSAHNSPVRKALFVPKGASEMKKRELAGSYEDFTPEPLLMENPNRFVLFPIEHADVWCSRGVRKVFSRCVAAAVQLRRHSRRDFFIVSVAAMACSSYAVDATPSHAGLCTKKLRPPSGRPRRSTSATT